MKPKKIARVEESLGLPSGVISGGTRMELCGNRRVTVEGCRRIVEYESDRICLQTTDQTIRFLGADLCVQRLSSGYAVLDGTLTAVEFL